MIKVYNRYESISVKAREEILLIDNTSVKIYKATKDFTGSLANNEDKLSLLHVNETFANTTSDKDPTLEDDFYPGYVWLNFETSEKFVQDKKRVNDKPVWLGNQGTVVIDDTSSIFDIFRDGSSLALYEFNNTLNDTGGLYNLTKHGKVSFGKGILNHCVSLNGSSYLTLDKQFNQRNIAVSFWIKLRRMRTSYSCLFHFSHSGDNTMSFWAHHGKGVYYLIYNNNDYYSPQSLIFNKWVHIVFQSDGTFWINNKKFHIPETVDCTSFNLPMIIGADRDGWSINDWTKCSVDETRIFNRLLTDSEVAQLYDEMARYL